MKLTFKVLLAADLVWLIATPEIAPITSRVPSVVGN